jgi:protein-tyrosine phosphatase
VPIDDSYHDELDTVWRQEGDHVRSVYDAYLRMLELLAPNFARAVEAVADAPAGGVVVHCFAGKDRTGLTCAMLLRLARVGIDDIAEDYGLSSDNLRPILEPWAESAPDERERALRVRIGSSPPQVMHDVLAELERRHAGVEGYLLEAGAVADTLDRVRARLLA